MKDNTKYVGLDVSKETIAVAVADEGREAPRFWGTIKNTKEAVKKLMRQLGDAECLQVCYEAGPTGYVLCKKEQNRLEHTNRQKKRRENRRRIMAACSIK